VLPDITEFCGDVLVKLLTDGAYVGVAVTTGVIGFSEGNGRISGVSVTVAEVLLSARTIILLKNRKKPKASAEMISLDIQ
jgi:hypothetical protein